MRLPDFNENRVFTNIIDNMKIKKDEYVDCNFNVEYKSIQFNDKSYTRDWANVAQSYMISKGWACEECGLDCSLTKYYLHVHHINGNRYNNSYRNLKSLCRKCYLELNKPYCK
ncbi:MULTISPECIES: HNH endonuclease signature motif containing protein [unclassified Romboutsia]|uniref:HNH endonuclease signature motif containing protein n=1 Tax=unclassified Romboutsia TaxID=2626894 RepID=UPI000820CC69|nr:MULTISPECIES: HNH endonuclease signature motif containing protein [unclassified Romboutsia]SCH44161.1 Uncharacterised protein [uncultured Clostridium sp.]